MHSSPTSIPSAAARLVLGVLVAFASLLAACHAPPAAEGGTIPPTLPAPTDPRSYVERGDVLSITIHRQPDLSSGEQGVRVDQDGDVDLPLLGPIAVRGLSLAEVRAAIRARAAEFVKDPTVAVSVLEFAPRPFYVLGAVQSAGRFPAEEPLTALQALSLAGGFQDGADLEEVALLRASAGELVVHFFNAASPGVDGMVGVAPGDLLFVRRSGAGTFRDQIAPYLQGVAAPLSALASVIIVIDRLGK